MNSLKTRDRIAVKISNDSAVKTRAHAMKTRTRTAVIAPPPPRETGIN